MAVLIEHSRAYNHGREHRGAQDSQHVFTPMKVALIVPGGVDRSGEYRVIPAIQALIKRLSLHHDVRVFALTQEPLPGVWSFAGAKIFNIGSRFTRIRA